MIKLKQYITINKPKYSEIVYSFIFNYTTTEFK